MRPLRKAQPQHHVDHCGACGGAGRTLERDWDDEDQPVSISATCEGCDGSGEVTSCDECDCEIPVTVAELNGYVCGPCKGDLEQRDHETDRSYHRRIA